MATTRSDQLSAMLSATRRAVIDGPGTTDSALRARVAFGDAPAELAPLVQKIRARPYTVTDADVDALRARYDEDELFELIVAAAVGAAGARVDAALDAVRRA